MQSPQNPDINAPSNGPHPHQHPLANYRFSSDELRVLKECNMESFFQRSLPFCAILGTSTYFAVQKGILSANVKYGATPKVVVSVIFGYFLGKMSYQNKCAEKMMRLPNSKLAQMLRQGRRQYGSYDTLPQQGFGTGLSLPPLKSSNSDMYSDEGLQSKFNSLDFDTKQPSQLDLDDMNKPNFDDGSFIGKNLIQEPPPTPSLTYEDLRKKNRENYLKLRNTWTDDRSQPSQKPTISVKPEEPQIEKNKYGDTWS